MSKQLVRFFKSIGAIIYIAAACSIAGLVANYALIYLFDYNSAHTFWAAAVTMLLAIIWAASGDAHNG